MSSRTVIRQVKPILSKTPEQAKQRVLQLYKAWYREIPIIVDDRKLPLNVKTTRKQLRAEFMKNAQIKDLRVIDMLVIKSRNDLHEITENWQTISCIMSHIKEDTKKPTDFLSKFLAGHD